MQIKHTISLSGSAKWNNKQLGSAVHWNGKLLPLNRRFPQRKLSVRGSNRPGYSWARCHGEVRGRTSLKPSFWLRKCCSTTEVRAQTLPNTSMITSTWQGCAWPLPPGENTGGGAGATSDHSLVTSPKLRRMRMKGTREMGKRRSSLVSWRINLESETFPYSRRTGWRLHWAAFVFKQFGYMSFFVLSKIWTRASFVLWASRLFVFWGFQLKASCLWCRVLFYKLLADGAWVAEWKIVWEVCEALCVFCGPAARHCLLSPARDPGNHGWFAKAYLLPMCIN